MYGTPNPDPAVRRDKRRASGFQVDPELEAMLKLKADDPDKFERIASPNLHMQLGFYESARAAHERSERNAPR